MADTSTVARPYAKAVFELARDNKDLANWGTVLELLAMLSVDESVVEFIHNPASTAAQQVELLMAVVDASGLTVDKTLVNNLLLVLAENYRLPALVDLETQFSAMRADFEKTIEVSVVSYSPLTKSQQESLIERLTSKLQRKVELNVSVDKSLQGGAIIRAGHLVYDASVGTQINKLSSTLTA